MRIRHLVYLFPVLVCCSGHMQGSDAVIIPVDPVHQETLSLFDFVESLEIIHLENVPEAWVSGQTLAAMSVSDAGYYLMDRRNGLIRVFDADGRFVELVDKVGRGPGEYTGGVDLQVCPSDSSVQVLSPTRGVYKYSIPDHYSYSGLAAMPDIITAAHHFALSPGGEYWFFSASAESRLHLFNPDTQEISSFLSDIPRWFSLSRYYDFLQQSPFYQRDGVVYFYTGHNGAVYRCDPAEKQITPVYLWDLGAYTLPLSELSKRDVAANNPSLTDKYNQLSHKYVLSVSRICETDRYLIAGAFFDERPITLLYDKKKRKSAVFHTVKENVRFYASFACGNSCYAVLDPEYLSLFLSKALIKDEKIELLLENPGENDNCVILKYNLKK